MSGSMYARTNCQLHWQSELEGDDFTDNDSQYSENGGVYRSRASDLGQRLRTLYKDRLFTDVKFVVNCGVKPKPEIYAHKAILAVGSLEFTKMLYGNVLQVAGKQMESEFEIKNVPFEAFKNVVEYLYTDDVYFEENAVVIQTMMAARKFQVQSLVNRCESYFESADLTEDSACITYQLAMENKIESLKNRCSQFIQENTRGVIRSEAFQTSTLSTVRSICKLPKLNLRSEEELFKATLKWVESQRGNQTNKRELIQPLLRHIRFSSIPALEFSQLVQKCPDIFTAEEAMNVVLYLSNPTQNTRVKLPNWFNKGVNRCFDIPQIQTPRGNQGYDKTMTISLRPIAGGYMSNLANILELKCHEGRYQIKALKLTFGEPVSRKSDIGHMVISVSCDISNYKFKEHLKINNSKEITVPFTQSMFMYPGQTISIHAEAYEVKNYRFLQFDDKNSFTDDIPFECNLGSVPKENRLFFINEVIYRALPVGPRRPSPVHYRGGRKVRGRN